MSAVNKLILAFAGVALLAACSGEHAAPGRQTAVACDRVCLEKLIDTLMTAMVAHDTSTLPLATGFRYVENNQLLKAGLGSWKTVQSFGPYRHYFADPESGNAAIIATMRENDEDGLFTLRIHAIAGRLAEAEAVFTQDPHGAADYAKRGKPADAWVETLPDDERMSREELAETANKYFGAMENNDGKGDYTFFDDDCNRLEQGRRTTNTAARRASRTSEPEFSTLGCRGQFETGALGLVTRVRDRRLDVIDVERGVVFGIAGVDHDGRTHSIPLTNGKAFSVPAYFSAARTLQVGEAFRLREGRITDIEATEHEFVYGMKAGLNATYDPSNEVPGGVAPDPLKVCDAACLVSTSDRLLAALVAHDPTLAPLADTAHYTENDQRLEFYDGLWGTLTDIGANRLRVVEPERGMIHVIVSTRETEIAGILSLRLRVRGDRVTEIEATIVREEHPDTEERYRVRPPVEADPAGLAHFDLAFSEFLDPPQRRQRLQLVALADRYLDHLPLGKGGDVAFTADCSRRENGVAVTGNPDLPRPVAQGRDANETSWGASFKPYALDCEAQLQSGYSAFVERVRDRRVLAVDVNRGLVATSAYYDIPGTVHSFTSQSGEVIPLPRVLGRPYTLSVQQVFRISGAAIQRIETVSKPLPYGARPYWRER